MAKKEFTDVFLRKVKDTHVEFSDLYVTGLRLRIQKRKKMFSYLYKIHGKKRRLTIGEYPQTTLKQARDAVIKAKADLINGIDPQAKKDSIKKAIAHEQGLTVEQGLRKFIDRHAKRNLKSWKYYSSRFERLDKKFKNILIADLKTATIRNYLDKISENSGENASNRLYQCLKSAFGWLYRNEYTNNHPMERMSKPNPHADKPRERVLSDMELKAVLNAANEQGYPFGDFTWVLILTGQRRGEVSTMERLEVDFQQKIWTIPASKAKNKKEHKVPLSDQVIDILQSLPTDGRHFFSTLDDRPINGFSKSINQIRELSGVGDWGYHDLRRTLATNLSKQKTPDVVISAILNHSTKALQGITSIYNKHDLLEERTEALIKYAHWVDRLMDDENDNVVSIETGR